MKKYLLMSSAAVGIGALRVKGSGEHMEYWFNGLEKIYLFEKIWNVCRKNFRL